MNILRSHVTALAPPSSLEDISKYSVLEAVALRGSLQEYICVVDLACVEVFTG